MIDGVSHPYDRLVEEDTRNIDWWRVEKNKAHANTRKCKRLRGRLANIRDSVQNLSFCLENLESRRERRKITLREAENGLKGTCCRGVGSRERDVELGNEVSGSGRTSGYDESREKLQERIICGDPWRRPPSRDGEKVQEKTYRIKLEVVWSRTENRDAGGETYTGMSGGGAQGGEKMRGKMYMQEGGRRGVVLQRLCRDDDDHATGVPCDKWPPCRRSCSCSSPGGSWQNADIGDGVDGRGVGSERGGRRGEAGSESPLAAPAGFGADAVRVGTTSEDHHRGGIVNERKPRTWRWKERKEAAVHPAPHPRISATADASSSAVHRAPRPTRGKDGVLRECETERELQQFFGGYMSGNKWSWRTTGVMSDIDAKWKWKKADAKLRILPQYMAAKCTSSNETGRGLSSAYPMRDGGMARSQRRTPQNNESELGGPANKIRMDELEGRVADRLGRAAAVGGVVANKERDTRISGILRVWVDGWRDSDVLTVPGAIPCSELEKLGGPSEKVGMIWSAGEGGRRSPGIGEGKAGLGWERS
ncbi:hypothetical protein C8R43DRAFT_965933 [Mycena crocata]|nr:hypothetical protein C8R43DRAFT_965933 [Mycena crocata]